MSLLLAVIAGPCLYSVATISLVVATISFVVASAIPGSMPLLSTLETLPLEPACK